jgi:hypothetical protein
MDGCAGCLVLWGGGALMVALGFFVANLFDLPACGVGGIILGVMCVVGWLQMTLHDMKHRNDPNPFE